MNKSLQNIRINPNATRYCIYVVESGGLYKIGSTSDIKSRLNVIKTSSPLDVNLNYTIPIPMAINYRDIEKALHHMFIDSHVKGEWYRLGMKDIAKIKSLSLQEILAFTPKKFSKAQRESLEGQMEFKFIDDDKY